MFRHAPLKHTTTGFHGKSLAGTKVSLYEAPTKLRQNNNESSALLQTGTVVVTLVELPTQESRRTEKRTLVATRKAGRLSNGVTRFEFSG